MNIIEALNWRHAVKGFDAKKKLDEKDFEEILESLRLSPSSFGLQPWKFVVVKNEQLREKLRPNAWNQPQTTDASHFIVLCSLKEMKEEFVERYLKYITEIRKVNLSTLDDYKALILGFLKNQSKEQISAWMENQIYIALGVLLAACALKGIETCPMEGFDRNKFDEILELDKYDIKSVVCCAIGYHSESDYLANAKKVRFPKNELVVEIE